MHLPEIFIYAIFYFLFLSTCITLYATFSPAIFSRCNRGFPSRSFAIISIAWRVHGVILISRLFSVSDFPHLHQTLSSKYRGIPSASIVISFFTLVRERRVAPICIEMKTFPFDRHLHCIEAFFCLCFWSSRLDARAFPINREFVHIRCSRSARVNVLVSRERVICETFPSRV